MTKLLHVVFVALVCIGGTFGNGLKCKFVFNMRNFSFSSLAPSLLPSSLFLYFFFFIFPTPIAPPRVAKLANVAINSYFAETRGVASSAGIYISKLGTLTFDVVRYQSLSTAIN